MLIVIIIWFRAVISYLQYYIIIFLLTSISFSGLSCMCLSSQPESIAYIDTYPHVLSQPRVIDNTFKFSVKWCHLMCNILR